MPKYLFRCDECGEEAEVEASTGSEAVVPECHGPMHRVWNPTFQLKGDGWTWRPNDEIPTLDLPDIPEERRSGKKR